MLDAANFRELVSGKRQGWAAALLRTALAAAEHPYAWAVAIRNRQFDRGTRPAKRVGVPVISVGNLTTGGTGKTPLVQWLAQWYLDRGVRVAIVSRGYGAADGRGNDEALELAQQLPGVPHVQNPDRVAAARVAIDQHAAELIVLDDAFQHRRIHRDLEIVLLDALEPFGYGHLLPRGLLREPLAGLGRAELIVLTRGDAVDAAQREAIRHRVAQYAPRAAWIETSHSPLGLLTSAGERLPLSALPGRSIAAFCGIGNPDGFRHSLAACGWQVARFREFPDHHAYDAGDLEQLARWAGASDATAVVCTQKDLVKIRHEQLAGKRLFALQIGLSIDVGREAVERRLRALLDRDPQAPGAST